MQQGYELQGQCRTDQVWRTLTTGGTSAEASRQADLYRGFDRYRVLCWQHHRYTVDTQWEANAPPAEQREFTLDLPTKALGELPADSVTYQAQVYHRDLRKWRTIFTSAELGGPLESLSKQPLGRTTCVVGRVLKVTTTYEQERLVYPPSPQAESPTGETKLIYQIQYRYPGNPNQVWSDLQTCGTTNEAAARDLLRANRQVESRMEFRLVKRVSVTKEEVLDE